MPEQVWGLQDGVHQERAMPNQQSRPSSPHIQLFQVIPKKKVPVSGRPPDGLFTWKEISAYAGRGVRTLQRWERNFGFPVHRPDRRNKSVVVSSKGEIDEWFRTRPMMQHGVMIPVRSISAKDLTISARKVELEAQRISESSRLMQEQLKKALETAHYKRSS